MKSLLDAYGSLWAGSEKKLEPLFKDIVVAHYPEEKAEIEGAAQNQKNMTIIIAEGSPLQELTHLLDIGYSHVVQKKRADFSRELLVTAILIKKPKAFVDNPKHFLLGNMQIAGGDDGGNTLDVVFQSSSQKNTIIEKLHEFLKSDPALLGLKDIASQVAEELLMNASFSAPINPVNQVRMYQTMDRTRTVDYPANKQGKFFAYSSAERLVIACIDPYGSLQKQAMVSQFHKLYKNDMADMRDGQGGAGIGLKYILDNSAIFFTMIQPGGYTCVACGFYLKGLKQNLSPQKHIHILTT
jgi:hypothetical protein